MEWIETTGRSVEEAKEAALDELGVDEAEAEFEILAQAQTGLFGRLRSEARVRARVRPTAPRAKEDRRDRRRRAAASRREAGNGASDTGGSGGGESDGAGTATTAGTGTKPARSPSGTEGRDSRGARGSADDASSTGGADAEGGPIEGTTDSSDTGGRRRRRAGRGRSAESAGQSGSARPTGSPRPSGPAGRKPQDAPTSGGGADDEGLPIAKGTEVEVPLDQQADVAVDFLTKLIAEFGLEAQVTVAHPDEETVELQLSGSDLGILIGPKGTTLVALQNLTRTVVFNETGGSNGHLNVDVGGYRQKRTEALARFATQIAEKVRQSGSRTVLEPMTAVDRKVVHDTIAGIEGVATTSEGEEPRRRVVVSPN